MVAANGMEWQWNTQKGNGKGIEWKGKGIEKEKE